MSEQSPHQKTSLEYLESTLIHLRAVAYSRECAAALADQRESCRSQEIQLALEWSDSDESEGYTM
jgi:hypothetical protein